MSLKSQVQSYQGMVDEKKASEIEAITFDFILSQIGFSWYQIYVFVIVGLIGMCDAGESQAISLVLPILEREWGISPFQESLLGSLVYVGYFFGSLLSGEIADSQGRRGPIIVASGLMSVIAVLGAFMWNFTLYLIFRVLLVACIGFIIPISFSMLAENTPMEQRGVVLICIGVFYTLGELTVCLLAYIFMPTLTSGDWRAVLMWASVPAILTLFISLFLLLESPRFCLISNKVEEAQKIISKIFKINNKKEEIIPIEVYRSIADRLRKQEIMEQGELKENNKPGQQFKKLLSRQFRKITCIVWYEWFTNTFVFAGITFLLPLTLQKLNPNKSDDSQEDLAVITLSCLMGLPVILVALVIVNIPSLGRKNSLVFSYFAVGVMGCLIYGTQNDGYFFGSLISVSKMFINLCFTISYQFVSELYPTYIRASGLGYASSIGRIGSIIMPWIVVYFNEIGTFISYGIFGVLALAASIATALLPFDTYKRELDRSIDE